MIENEQQLKNTRQKLQELQELFDRKKSSGEGGRALELTLRSLKGRINRLQEELARYAASIPG
jgi:predicted  nucleic acid-binding Zn-ribbon protein